jgi:hypothetical protein
MNIKDGTYIKEAANLHLGSCFTTSNLLTRVSIELSKADAAEDEDEDDTGEVCVGVGVLLLLMSTQKARTNDRKYYIFY